MTRHNRPCFFLSDQGAVPVDVEPVHFVGQFAAELGPMIPSGSIDDVAHFPAPLSVEVQRMVRDLQTILFALTRRHGAQNSRIYFITYPRASMQER